MVDRNLEIPKKMMYFFEDARYKIAYGGRGSGKSWTAARALIAKASSKRMRILCTREIQKSIKQSVHALLSDQIEMLGLQDVFEILETEIRCTNGSEITFAGLSNMTATSIKSYEGYDLVWVEEAQTVSKTSWDILIPTIRKADSEIWVTFNPILDSDDTYRRFVLNPPPDSISEFINYMDNPWFSEVLEQERIHCKETDPENYDNIWEGHCRPAVEGAIYAKEVARAWEEQRITRMPYDPRLKVHTIWDLGWNDSMAIILVQRLRSEIRLIKYIEDSHRTLDSYAADLNQMRYNWGSDWLPHDGVHEEYRTGKSARQILKACGRKVEIVPKTGIEEGIQMARTTFSQCIFDKVGCEQLIECLKRYRRHVNSQTEEPTRPVHDKHSHGADAFRYLSVAADQLRNEDDEIEPTQRIVASVPGMGY